MDEKMKDAVKITVIATGFREIPVARHRTHEVRTSFAAAHEEAMEFPEALERHEPMPEPEPAPVMAMDETAYADEAAPTPAAQDRADVISLDTMRSAMVSNFEQNDLDVPAFLRKRNEVM
jgi:hypothetical protein